MPFFTRELAPTIFIAEPFKSYDSAYNLSERIKQEYWALCDYTHTRGWKHFAGYLRGVIEGTKFYTETHPSHAKEIWENWLLKVRSVYQNLSLLFALATPSFCHILKSEKLPIPSKMSSILTMMDEQDVQHLTEFVKSASVSI